MAQPIFAELWEITSPYQVKYLLAIFVLQGYAVYLLDWMSSDIKQIY